MNRRAQLDSKAKKMIMFSIFLRFLEQDKNLKALLNLKKKTKSRDFDDQIQKFENLYQEFLKNYWAKVDSGFTRKKRGSDRGNLKRQLHESERADDKMETEESKMKEIIENNPNAPELGNKSNLKLIQKYMSLCGKALIKEFSQNNFFVDLDSKAKKRKIMTIIKREIKKKKKQARPRAEDQLTQEKIKKKQKCIKKCNFCKNKSEIKDEKVKKGGKKTRETKTSGQAENETRVPKKKELEIKGRGLLKSLLHVLFCYPKFVKTLLKYSVNASKRKQEINKIELLGRNLAYESWVKVNGSKLISRIRDLYESYHSEDNDYFHYPADLFEVLGSEFKKKFIDLEEQGDAEGLLKYFCYLVEEGSKLGEKVTDNIRNLPRKSAI